LSENTCAAICDVANSAGLYAGSLTEKYQCAFQDFGSADRSTLQSALPSIKAFTLKLVSHSCNLNAQKQSRQA
jgi:hypothetical protein